MALGGGKQPQLTGLFRCHLITFIVDHNKRMKDGLEYVMQKYLNPLRKLTADLPNHAIEMQIEILDSIPNISTKQNPQRRLIRVINTHHPKSVKRSQDVSQSSAQAEATTTTTSATSEALTTAVATAPANSAPVSADSSKLPVYMDDLKKALEELEKKLSSTGETAATTTTSTGSDMPCNGGFPQQSNSGTPVRNIDDIVQLLKKAIHVERRVPQPNDNNLEWVQLKIPKNV